jgi:hypothetical protein
MYIVLGLSLERDFSCEVLECGVRLNGRRGKPCTLGQPQLPMEDLHLPCHEINSTSQTSCSIVSNRHRHTLFQPGNSDVSYQLVVEMEDNSQEND